jgi:riboflavin synthase alpha subunit
VLIGMKIGIAGQLKVGDKVNVERAMAAHTRFGGHMVQVSIPQRSSGLLRSTAHID